MRRFAVVCCAAVLAGCAKSGDQSASGAASVPPGAIALADVAGTWTVHSRTETGDTIPGYVLTATTDTSGWTLTFANRPPMHVRVLAVAGDSIVIEVGPYQSVLRKDTQVTTHVVNRLRDGKLLGWGEARYDTPGPDTVLRIRTEGTRAP